MNKNRSKLVHLGVLAYILTSQLGFSMQIDIEKVDNFPSNTSEFPTKTPFMSTSHINPSIFQSPQQNLSEMPQSANESSSGLTPPPQPQNSFLSPTSTRTIFSEPTSQANRVSPLAPPFLREKNSTSISPSAPLLLTQNSSSPAAPSFFQNRRNVSPAPSGIHTSTPPRSLGPSPLNSPTNKINSINANFGPQFPDSSSGSDYSLALPTAIENPTQYCLTKFFSPHSSCSLTPTIENPEAFLAPLSVGIDLPQLPEPQHPQHMYQPGVAPAQPYSLSPFTYTLDSSHLNPIQNPWKTLGIMFLQNLQSVSLNIQNSITAKMREISHLDLITSPLYVFFRIIPGLGTQKFAITHTQEEVPVDMSYQTSFEILEQCSYEVFNLLKLENNFSPLWYKAKQEYGLATAGRYLKNYLTNILFATTA